MKRKILIFMAGILTVLFISGCIAPETDVQFTRRVFNGLCKGNQRVQNSIDWENLVAVGVDVGKAYSAIVSEKTRKDYRKVFFFNLSYSFKASGGKASIFFNWRVKERGADKTIIAADTKSGKVLLLTLSYKGGKRKISAINWQE